MIVSMPHDHSNSHDDHDQRHDQRHDQSHGHSHAHPIGSHGHGPQSFGFAFVLNFFLSIVEMIGGIWIGSFSIVAGAIHDFGDSISLALAWYLEHIANRKKNTQFNFGYRRFSLLSALIAGVIILSGSIIICFHSLNAFTSVHHVDPQLMLAFAILGILVNGISAWRMSRGRTKNERVLTWHLFEDFLSWLAVLISAIVIYFTGITWLDPVIAIAVSIFVAYNVYRHLKSTIYLFLQARPEEFSESQFIERVLKIGGVFKVTNIAIWSLDGVQNILSCRIIFSRDFSVSQLELINKEIKTIANDQGHFDVTIEAHYAPDCDCPVL